jgi:hypothetical protein
MRRDCAAIALEMPMTSRLVVAREPSRLDEDVGASRLDGTNITRVCSQKDISVTKRIAARAHRRTALSSAAESRGALILRNTASLRRSGDTRGDVSPERQCSKFFLACDVRARFARPNSLKSVR